MARNKIISDKNQIIDTALRLIDEEGIEAASMRRLSKELGVSSMTLYNYVQNSEDVLREILIRSFNSLYEQMYTLLSAMPNGKKIGIQAYAKAYAMAMYAFSSEHGDIAAYLVGRGSTIFRDDAELRHFYDPFDIFYLGDDKTENCRLKKCCRLFECTLSSLITEHTIGAKRIQPADFEELIDLLIAGLFP